MGFRTTVSAKLGLHGQLKLARLMEMSERDFESRIREVEASPLFARLLKAGAVRLEPYERSRFAARRFGGWDLKTSSEGLPDLLNGNGEMVQLIQRVGQERFEECFLKDDELSDEDRARSSGITPAQARQLREFVNRLYIQAEFESPAAESATPKVFSAVAGVEVSDGKPVLGFFNREIWKGRYRVDSDKYALLKGSLPQKESQRLEQLLRQLEFLDRRKSTLYRVLEALLEQQADFFVTGDPDRRRPLTQRALASQLEVTPSVLNRLLSNKSIQLPWGLESPLRTLVPSAKSLLRDRFHGFALAHPDLPDEALRRELERAFGAKLSRRSIAQYRKELGLGGRGRRQPSARS